MKELKQNIKAKYAHEDAEILIHGKSYFLTASKIYKNLGTGNSYSIYPLLTLLGISAELFFKTFDATVNEGYEGSSMISKSIEPNKRIHDLNKLFRRCSNEHKELFDFISLSYRSDTERDLQQDLAYYALVFVESRYIFQQDKRKYLGDIDIIFQLVKSLYDSVNHLYED